MRERQQDHPIPVSDPPSFFFFFFSSEPQPNPKKKYSQWRSKADLAGLSNTLNVGVSSLEGLYVRAFFRCCCFITLKALKLLDVAFRLLVCGIERKRKTCFFKLSTSSHSLPPFLLHRCDFMYIWNKYSVFSSLHSHTHTSLPHLTFQHPNLLFCTAL